jgi:hypothetical protein
MVLFLTTVVARIELYTASPVFALTMLLASDTVTGQHSPVSLKIAPPGLPVMELLVI